MANSMDGELLAALIGLIGFVLGIAIQWGSQKAAISQAKAEIEDLKVIINSFRQEFVTYRHFESVISDVKESVRSMQTDLKEILKHVKQ